MCDANRSGASKPNGVQYQKNKHSCDGLRMLSVCDHLCILAVTCIRNARMHWGVSAQHATNAHYTSIPTHGR